MVMATPFVTFSFKVQYMKPKLMVLKFVQYPGVSLLPEDSVSTSRNTCFQGRAQREDHVKLGTCRLLTATGEGWSVRLYFEVLSAVPSNSSNLNFL